MGIFSNVSGARKKMNSEYMGPGHYIARIDAVKTIQNRNKLNCFVVEMQNLHTVDDADGHPNAHRAGDSMSFLTRQDSDFFDSEVRAFFEDVVGMEPDDMTEDNLEMAMADDQPLAGMFCEVKATEIVTKKGNPFTKINFKRAVPAAELAEYLTEQEVKRFFPGDKLNEVIEQEQKAAEAADSAE